jgi:Flp pilus assembly protein CpaB
MSMKRQLVLLCAVMVAMVAGSGAFASAQAKKPATKKAPTKRARVFFVEPKNGATVTSPLHMKFGSENIQIAAVPQGDVTTARKGIAHYHVGLDQNCLPAGKNIVKGTPSWVHFGDGKDVFDTQLTPGKHKLSVQLGDDLHNTLPGTCQTITVTVK